MKKSAELINNNRIEWIDVSKAIGIFLIYLGHIVEVGIRTIEFVFIFHVPLFFFISGSLENLNRENDIIKNFKKNIKKILIPTLFFATISLIICTINENLQIDTVFLQIKLILKGLVRNTYFVNGLWFLVCLFVMRTMFSIIKKIKSKTIILLIGLSMFLIANFVITPNPIMQPHWYYNIDSALYYFNYYVIGYLTFPYIQKLLQFGNLKKKLLFVIILLVTFVYTFLLFIGINLLEYIPIKVSVISTMLHLIKTYIPIVFVILISYILKENKLLKNIGKNTLYLCGSEYIIKLFVSSFIGLIGLNITYFNPISVYIYTFILIVAALYILVPIEKQILNIRD